LENHFGVFSFGRSFSRDSDSTTKLTTRALCERVLTRNEMMAGETDESAETPKSIQNERYADINMKLQKNFILEGFPVSSGQFFEI
jgi:hypothetical protein